MVLFLLFVQLNVESPFLVKIQTEIEDETIQTEMMMMAVVVMDQPEGRRTTSMDGKKMFSLCESYRIS